MERKHNAARFYFSDKNPHGAQGQCSSLFFTDNQPHAWSQPHMERTNNAAIFSTAARGQQNEIQSFLFLSSGRSRRPRKHSTTLIPPRQRAAWHELCRRGDETIQYVRIALVVRAHATSLHGPPLYCGEVPCLTSIFSHSLS